MGQTFTSEINGGGPLYLGNTRVGFVSSSSDFFKEFMKVLPNNCNVGVAQAISKNKYSNTGFMHISNCHTTSSVALKSLFGQLYLPFSLMCQ